MNIVDAFDGLAVIDPERPLFTFYDRSCRPIERLTRGSFAARSRMIARRLIGQHGVAAGDRVILAYPPGLQMIAAFFGVLRAGGIPVPVPPIDQRASRDMMAFVAADCGAHLVLTAGPERHPALVTIATDEWPNIETDFTAHLPEINPTGDIAFIQYTSGSTSAPKGVVVTHANILSNRAGVVDHDEPVAVTWLPQYHDMGLIGYLLYPGLSGGSIHAFAAASFVQRPKLWLDLITQVRATASSAPNFAFDHVLDRLGPADFASVDLSSMRILMAAAEPIRPETYARFLRAMTPRGLDPAAFYVAYGLAEATLAVTSYGRSPISVSKKALARGIVRETASAAGIGGALHLMSCGRPLGGARVAIVNDGSEADEATVGDVWVSGPGVAAGYWQRPDESARTFANRLESDPATPYLATGDRGFMHQGELFICGRAKDVIIIRGQNIYPQDIEASIERALPAVREGGVMAFQLEREGDPAVVAVVETGRGEADPHAAVRAVRVEHGVDLAELIFVRPRSAPRTTSGKPMRHRARAMFEAGSFEPVVRYVRPPGDAVTDRPFHWLLARYQLRGDEDRTLAEIGLDSLDVVNLIHELQELLVAHGAAHLIENVDARSIQRLPVCALFGIPELLEAAPASAIAEVAAELRAANDDAQRREHQQLAADARLPPPALCSAATPQTPAQSNAAEGIFLTGATGFLGPFLLASLIERTQQPIHALVRASTPDEAHHRLRQAITKAGLPDHIACQVGHRIQPVTGDLEQPSLGLSPADWNRLTRSTGAVYHNGALVNYLFDYARMRAANVDGTREMLRFATEGHPKPFNHISTTFIFGWATKPVLYETDSNADMKLLDFGYSQSKWSSEQIVLSAGRAGLPVRIFRPALLTPAIDGGGGAFDITIRLLTFMIQHGISVTAQNQVSFIPVDVAANNIIAIAQTPNLENSVFHVVRDDFHSMRDITDEITAQTGRPFQPFPLASFVPEVIRRCTSRDILFPLLDFLVGSVDNIASMEFKRYDNTSYRAARAQSPYAQPDPSLTDTVTGMLRFIDRQGLLRV